VFGSVGFPELLFIFIIALLLFGPRQLPSIGKSLGRALAEFRRASNDFKRTIEEEVAADEIKGVEQEIKKTVSEVRDAAKLDDSGPAGEAGADKDGETAEAGKSGDPQRGGE